MKSFLEFKETPEWQAIARKMKEYEDSFMLDLVTQAVEGNASKAAALAGKIECIAEFYAMVEEALTSNAKKSNQEAD